MKRQCEQGSALLTVLLLIGVIGGMAALALDRLRTSMHVVTNGVALDQARAFALAAEAIAASRIDELTRRSSGKVTLAGGWNGRQTRLPLPGGVATVSISDGGNCFNLNSVAQGDVGSGLSLRPAGVNQFRALMKAVGVPEEQARTVAASLGDWVDSDRTPVPGGAEDETYAQTAIPYRAANALLADVSELRAVAGVTPAVYDGLKRWLCVLPTAELSPINVNTLTLEQAPLLAMLLPEQLSLASARTIIAARPADGWRRMEDFWGLPALVSLQLGDALGQAAITTRWFNLNLDIELAGAELNERGLIDARSSPARIVARSWGNPLG